MPAGPLGRRVPTDWTHLDRYPLRAAPPAVIDRLQPPTPVVIGVNWYENFDRPVRKDGAWWIGLDAGRLGRIRGGHCVCLRPAAVTDPDSWWTWFDQVAEGICVSEGVTRAVALITRKRCHPRPLYDAAQLDDEFPDTPPEEGTSVNAGLRVATRGGLVLARPGEPQALHTDDVGRDPDYRPITSFHWITGGMDEVRSVLSLGGTRQYVVLVNSWGRAGYPHFTRMPLETLERLRLEDGELGVPVFSAEYVPGP